MSVEKASRHNSARITHSNDTGNRENLWQFASASGSWFKLRNLESGLLAGVEYMSKSDNAPMVQFEDNGTDDHLWRVESKGDGFFVLRNKNSGLVMGLSRDDANLAQVDSKNSRDQWWSLLIVAYVKL
jgi:ricin-type beta-trefoil lectin protein